MGAPIRAVVFDFGGVLISPITTLIAEVAGWHDVSMVEMLDVLMGPRETSTTDHPWHRAERGEIAIAEMQREVSPFGPYVDICGRWSLLSPATPTPMLKPSVPP